MTVWHRELWTRVAELSKELPRGRISNLIRTASIGAVRNLIPIPDLDKELNELSLNLKPVPQNDKTSILITGCTGYIGIFTLQEALKIHDTVVCLVRAKSQEHGYKRLQTTAENFGLRLNIEEVKDKIRIVLGDCKKEKFGISDELFEEIGSVIHCAMSVTYFEPYELLRKTWVLNFVEFANRCVAEGVELKVLGSVLWRAVDETRSYWSNGYSRVAKMKRDISLKYSNHGCNVIYYDLGFPAPPLYVQGCPQVRNIVLAMLSVGFDIKKWKSAAIVPSISVDILSRILLMSTDEKIISCHSAVLSKDSTRTEYGWDSVETEELIKVMHEWPQPYVETMRFEEMDLNGDAKPFDVSALGLRDCDVKERTFAKIYEAAELCAGHFKDDEPISDLEDLVKRIVVNEVTNFKDF